MTMDVSRIKVKDWYKHMMCLEIIQHKVLNLTWSRPGISH